MINDIIEVQNLTKKFGDHLILDNISFSIKKNQSLVIMGLSGTGKSVLIKIMVGLLNATSGKILIEGNVLNTSKKDEYLAIIQKIGFLFQSSALFDSLSVLENITFFATKLYKLDFNGQMKIAKNSIEKVGLSSKVLHLFPQELSGGMQKRVALARAICTNPEIIFLDEPTTGLDPIMANIINALIVDIRNDLGATTITISHDVASTRLIATDLILLNKGKIAWQGTIDDLNTSDNLYLDQFINGKTHGPIQL
jgi:phospholipid/cholesterol/gamma-HCH transport system ATP-binding protein